MSDSTAQRLSLKQVRHVAKLCRLHLRDDQLERYRVQLASILDHIAKLDELDVEGIEPMAHPIDIFNRMDDDEVAPPMPIEHVIRNAPATEDRFLAVPKVLGDASAGSS